ncbi:MAG TPA: type II secretion system F family protein [Polyangia bacterium]
MSVQQAISMPSQSVSKAKRPPVKAEELSRMAGLFANKLKAGLSVGQALYALSVELKQPRLVAALKGVKASVDTGRSLGEALRGYPDVFDEITVALLAAGEKSGRLQVELQRLSGYLGISAKIARGLYTATRQPLLGLGGGLLIFLTVLAVAAPFVERTLQHLHEHQWPAATHLAIHVARVARPILPMVLVLVVLAYVVYRVLMRADKGVIWRDNLLMQAPIIGSLWRAKAVAHFTRTSGVLAAAGVPLVEAMEMAAMTGGSLAVRGAVVLATDKLRKGRDLPTALAEVGLASRAEINAMQAAERRGSLGEFLLKHAESSDAELLRSITRLKSIVQSLIILVLGLLSAGAVFGLVGPAFFV